MFDLIRRAFVAVGSRQIHLRHAGRGPTVVLIHRAPTSSRSLDLEIEALARAGFLAVALDIPGLGLSDSIEGPRIEIEDLAEDLARTLDALGFRRVALHGSHTGALIAAAFARDHPERVTALLADGYPFFGPKERTHLAANYFPSNDTRWDGAHLLWLWARYREQHLFWPWNSPGEATPAGCDVPDPEFLHEGVIDMLRAGSGYQRAYAAAFRCSGDELLASVRVPVYLLAYPDDPLTGALNSLTELPRNCVVERLPSDRIAGMTREVELLCRHPADVVEAPFAGGMGTVGTSRAYVDVERGQLALCVGGPKTGRPLVVLPPIPGSAWMLNDEIRALSQTRPVVAIDAPGCGDSDPCGVVDAESLGGLVAQAIDRLGLTDFDLYAVNGGCTAAVEVARQRPRLDRSVVLESPVRQHQTRPDYADRYAPPIEPRWDGTHLLTLWHMTRARHLFRPWYEQRLVARYTAGSGRRLDAEMLDRELLAYLGSWRSYASIWRLVLGHATVQQSRQIGRRVALISQASDEFHDPTMRLLPEALAPRIAVLLGVLNQCASDC